MAHTKIVYLLPGRYEELTGELGTAVRHLGFGLCGRSMASGFDRMRFSEQLERVEQDLRAEFWRDDAVLIGRSYGAYVLLHSLAEMCPFPGKVLLFSPVLGAAFDKSRLWGAMPPRAEKLTKLAEAGQFPPPRLMEIHTGADDNGCDPRVANRFSSLVSNSKTFVVAGAGHQLAPGYVTQTLTRFLVSSII